MAVAGEFASHSSLLGRSSLLPDPKILKMEQRNSLCFSTPALFPAKQGKLPSRSLKVMRPTVATISEEVLSLVVGKPAKIKVRAVVTVRRKIKEDFRDAVANQFDALSDKIGRNVVLELISTEISETKKPKKSGEAVIKDWYEKMKVKGERAVYTVDFTVDSGFGDLGVIAVANRHQREFFLESIVVEGFDSGTVHFLCNSWVQSTKNLPSKRVFFSNKSYLPWETPEGLKELREKELMELRGDGKGLRRISDRIYDYDIYNDLGNPDKGKELTRPNLGGEKLPYPRRCRTGRPPTDTITGNDPSSIRSLLQKLQSQFALKQLGDISLFLGIQDFPPANQPRRHLHRLPKKNSSNNSPFQDPSLYRRLAGSLQYLSITRPDIAFATNRVCQHMQNPTEQNFQDLKRLLRYIKGTLTFGLPITTGSLVLHSYSDADWASDSTDRKSISGFCTFLGPNLISWTVKKQATVAKSSTEAEYRSLSAATSEVLWLRRLAAELKLTQPSPTIIHCDNTSAIAIAKNPVFHARTKHIEIDYHFIRQHISSGNIQLAHISSNDQIADILTKSFTINRFHVLRNKLTIRSSNAQFEGRY